MRATVFHRPGTPLDIEDISIDKPGPHEVLIRTVAAMSQATQAAHTPALEKREVAAEPPYRGSIQLSSAASYDFAREVA